VRAMISGWWVAIQLASASAWKYATVPDRRAARKASAHAPPTGLMPSARRWSSQMIAGRSGWPSRSTLITVARWVVSATPLIAALGMSVLCQSCWQAWHSASQK